MAGINLGGILKNILGGDIDKMDDQQLAEAIQRVKDTEEAKPKTSLGDLMCMPPKEWSHHGVGLVKYIAAEGVTPCELCAPLVGKYLTPIDGDFYFNIAKKNHRDPFCIQIVPATNEKGGDECDLPPYPEDGALDVLDFSIPHKWVEDIYDREHPQIAEDGDDEDGASIQFDRTSFEAGMFSGYNPWSLMSAIHSVAEEAEEDEDISWLIPAIDQAITSGLYGYALPRAERLRGDIFLRAGNKVAALSAYRHAISLDPKIGLKRKVAAMEKELGQDAGL